MKGSLIMGERQKETLSPSNYFGGKGGEGQVEGATIEIKTFFPGKLCPYRILSGPSCEAGDQLPLVEPPLLSDDDWLRPAGTGSDSMVPTVPPL